MAAITTVAAEMTVADATGETVAAATAAVETSAGMMTTVDAVTIFVLSRGLNKDPLCLTRIRAADVRNLKITATDNKSITFHTFKNVRESPAHFFEKLFASLEPIALFRNHIGIHVNCGIGKKELPV